MSRRRPEPPADRPEEPQDAESAVRSIVLRRLSAAPRTRAELQRDLDKRGADPTIVTAVLDRFEEVGLIDDAEFARMWVESRHRTKGLARSALRRELHDRGVERDLIDQALAQIDDDDEWNRAVEFAARKVRVRPGEPTSKAIQRLAGQLSRKGYSPGVSFAVARECVGDSADLLGDSSP